nr:hypothetical protein GCM10017611_79680 [Rhodococcus wratislaviensis]
MPHSLMCHAGQEDARTVATGYAAYLSVEHRTVVLYSEADRGPGPDRGAHPFSGNQCWHPRRARLLASVAKKDRQDNPTVQGK